MCIFNQRKGGKTLIIGERTIEDIKRRVEGLLRDYLSSIDRVLDEEGEVKISMPVDIDNKRGLKVKVGIKFVTDKIDDSSTGYVHEDQPDLFDNPKEPEEPDFEWALEEPNFEWAECEFESECTCIWTANGGQSIPDKELEGFFIESLQDLLTWQWKTVERIEETEANEEGFEDVIDSGEGFKFYDGQKFSCIDCEFHRGMINKHKGVKIPVGGGKCIRTEGLCEKEYPGEGAKIQI